MKILQSAGFTAPDSYAAIKAISKKKAEKVLKLKEQFMEGFTKLTDDPAATEKVWTIINDATSYLLLLNTAIRTGCNYLAFNVPNTLCNACGYISKHRLDTCSKCGSHDLDYATRIIGSLKLISRFAHDRQIEANKRHYSHGLEENHEGKAES